MRVQKGFGYHLDLFVLSLLIIVCSLLGLPWFVAATVRSVTHVRSLIKLSDVSAPGERPEMLGVRSHFCADFVFVDCIVSVSYTHLTLPTIYSV